MYLLCSEPNRPSVLRSSVAPGAFLRADPRVSAASLSPAGSTSEEVSRWRLSVDCQLTVRLRAPTDGEPERRSLSSNCNHSTTARPT